MMTVCGKYCKLKKSDRGSGSHILYLPTFKPMHQAIYDSGLT